MIRDVKEKLVFDIVNNSAKEITQIDFDEFGENNIHDILEADSDSLLFKKMFKVKNLLQ